MNPRNQIYIPLILPYQMKISNTIDINNIIKSNRYKY